MNKSNAIGDLETRSPRGEKKEGGLMKEKERRILLAFDFSGAPVNTTVYFQRDSRREFPSKYAFKDPPTTSSQWLEERRASNIQIFNVRQRNSMLFK